MLDDVVAKTIMGFVARSGNGLGRFEAHVVPAEILETGSDLAEALRTHGRARRALSSEETGREGSERLGFGVHSVPRYWPTTRRPKPPTGRGLAWLMPGAAFGAANTVRRKFFSSLSEI